MAEQVTTIHDLAEDDRLAVELGDLTVRLYRRLRRSSARELMPFGLTDTQARVLRTVGRAGKPLRMSEIARQIEIGPRSVASVVDGLATRGLLLREIDPDNRRSILVYPTEAGSKLIAELGRDRAEAAAVLFGRLQPVDRKELLRLLTVVDEGG